MLLGRLLSWILMLLGKAFFWIVMLLGKAFFWILKLIYNVANWIDRQWDHDLLLLGLYEVDRSDELGSGTYGIVWMARNIQTNEDVAVKKVKITEVTKTYVNRELELLSKCDHSNIIKLLHSEEHNDCRYFVMEYCIHGNLNAFIKDREISDGLCVKFLLNVAEAVNYLHRQRISHRDIKPTNILVSEDDGYFLKLADFGLARYFPASSSGIPATLNTGTLGWMAPEVHDNSSLDSRYNKSADVFSLGLLFLALVLHRLGEYLEPFTENGRFLGQWMEMQHSMGLAIPVPDIGDKRDKQIQLIHRMLAFLPDERYRMPDVCKKLHELPRDEERVTRYASTTPPQPRRSSRRRTRGCTRGAVCVVSMMVLVLALVAGIYLTKDQGSQDQGSNALCEDIWNRLDINFLATTLKKNLHGQHLAVEAIVQAFREHTKHPRPERPLVLSMHGPEGVGKSYAGRLIAAHLYEEGLNSPFVHLEKGEQNLFINEADEVIRSLYLERMKARVRGHVRTCPYSLFIFEQAHSLHPIILEDLKYSLRSDFRKSIFLFESITRAGGIAEKTMEHYEIGQHREDITLKSMREVITATDETDDDWHFDLYASLVSAFVPFLLMERKHLLQCILDALQFSGDVSDGFVAFVADTYDFIEVASTRFSEHGCQDVGVKAARLYMINMI